jgi:ABC-type transport system substrate-binding protein
VSVKDAKAKEASNFWINAQGVVQPFTDRSIKGQWDPIIKKYVEPGSAQAVKDAKKLLSQTPFAGGFTADFHTTVGNPVRTAQENVIANNLKAHLNIDVNPNFDPISKIFGDWSTGSVLHHGQFQIAMFAFVFNSPEPDGSKYNFQSKYIDRAQTVHTSIDANYAGIRDSAIDKAFDKAAYTFDPKVRRANYYLIQRYTNQKAYMFPLYYRPQIATNSTRLKNFKNTAVGEATWNAYEWKTNGTS